MNIKNTTNKFPLIWNILLYSLLGCFSLFFFIHYTDIPLRHQEKLMRVETFLSAIILFNGIGLSLKYINNWLTLTYPSFIRNRKMPAIFLSVSAFFLLGTNYVLLVTIKYLIGSTHPFKIALQGIILLLIVFLIELFITGLMMINQFYKNLIEMYRQRKELEDSTIKARYAALQNQLNPHFLFNSLNTLIAEIEYAPRKAIEFTQNLSDIYRYILSNQNKQLISLDEELKFIHKFISLHKVRLGNCLILENKIPQELYEYSIPPLTLELLIENVFKHNIVSTTNPMKVLLYTEHTDKEDWLVISNPIYPKPGVPSSGKGLDNLSERNKLLHGKGIIIEKKNNHFTVKVPIFDEYE